MDNQTVEKVRRMWETWDIRVFILGSLSIQALLTFLAPFRKTSASAFLRFLIWVLYLSADAIGVFVIGLISSNEADSPHKKEILAFWAPFVLLHLGGPDTITALALEDNELWHRHALQLVTQVTITIYVFVLSFRHNGLLAPTMLMFVDGFWKYFERTCALFFASADSFRDSLVGKPEPGPNYARLMEEYFSAKDAHIPTLFRGPEGPVVRKSEGRSSSGNQNQSTGNNNDSSADEQVESDEKMVIKAHQFYNMFRAVLADGFLSLKDRTESRSFFVRNHNAFRIIEIELNLIYDRFYTKIFLFQKRRTFARFVCFIAVTMSLIIFCLKDTSKYDKVDVRVTLVLLGGAIILDITAALMYVKSDWGIIMSWNRNVKSYYRSLLLLILKYSKWARQPGSRRWSDSISKYNLLKRFFRKPPFFFNYFTSIKRIRDILIGMLYVEIQESNEELIEFVIKELKEKATQANEVEVAKEVCSARGNLVLQVDYFLASECLTPWTIDVDYDESLLIWHLATDLCYWESDEIEFEEGSKHNREISNALSEYMSYMLLRQQTMLSSVVGMSETRFEDTCAEARKFMNNNSLNNNWFKDPWWMAKRFLRIILRCQCRNTTSQELAPSEREEISFYKKFSRKVLEVKADVQPIIAKGDKSKSVLFDACRLAKQLEMFGEKQWEVTSKVWVELLCYAAVRCSPRSHIAQLSKGGELITLVWLYMAHLGLGERFLQNQRFGWTKLYIEK